VLVKFPIRRRPKPKSAHGHRFQHRSWNRLEGRPRSHDFDQSLRAEVRDPLWMLCGSGSLANSKGEDAGSAVVAKTQVSVSRLNRFAGQPSAAQLLTDVSRWRRWWSMSPFL